MSAKKPALILEPANSHGGDRVVLREIIERFSTIPYSNLGMKFQVFHPDGIALPDFSWYQTYQELFFEKCDWADFISLAKSKSLDVWIDVFDLFGVEVLEANLENVTGIKLQSSVAQNAEVLEGLKTVDVTPLKLIVNVSGFEISEVYDLFSIISENSFQEIILQAGFQDYPTDVKDSGLNKIQVLRSAFPDCSICFADHTGGTTALASVVPICAATSGCEYIEKHVCHDREEAKYDAMSAMEYEEVLSLATAISDVSEGYSGKFVNAKEQRYLDSTVQIPITKKQIQKGALISLSDLHFKRTGQKGINYSEILDEQKAFKVLGESLNEGKAINSGVFRSATIGAIVACRMKSTRLSKKAELRIDDVTSIEHCLASCLKMSNIDSVVLATSNLDQDSVLEKYAVNPVLFSAGSPDDVISRYLRACDEFGIDVIVRVTGDCPFVSPEITSVLLERHFSSGADYTAPRNCSVGTSPEIYNVEALRRVVDHFGVAEHSEYMTFYMMNNPEVFKLNVVDLPDDLVRDYRMTLDHHEDLEMFEALIGEVQRLGLEQNIYSFFKVLDDNPGIAKINADLPLRYKSDEELINFLNKVTKMQG